VPDTPMCVCSVDRGCNLRCSYCNTQYACDESRLMDMEKIIKKVEAFNALLWRLPEGNLYCKKKPRFLVKSFVIKVQGPHGDKRESEYRSFG
jgi:hypothetical protein